MSILRTPTRAEGGITPEEKAQFDKVAEFWIKNAMRTDRADINKLAPAIHGIYKAAGLKKPRVVLVPSPLVMVAAYGACAAIWYQRKNRGDVSTRAATYDATRAATITATRAATRAATRNATNDATDDAIHDATYAATHAATYAATHAATDAATRVATAAATHAATHAATDAATRAATRAATITATRVATVDATLSATDDATYAATRAATITATRVATDAATRAATAAATHAATRNATNDATFNTTVNATEVATLSATDDATYAATSVATHDATEVATRVATDEATFNTTVNATRFATDAMMACRDIAGEMGVECAKLWWKVYQGGNMWAYWDAYLSGARDVLGLRLPEHEAYKHWEQASLNGGFRVMHEEFCIVSDFPEVLRVDENNQPHCENGPSHRWRDGWEIYHWHGVRVPAHWIMSPDTVDPAEVLAEENVEVRAAGISIIGMAKMLDRLQHKIIDSDPDPMKGDLVEVRLPDLPDPVYYLSANCPRNGRIMEAVNPSEMDEMTVKGAQAWRLGIPASEFVYPTVRT